MDPQTDKIMKDFLDLEKAAEDLLTDKQTLIDLDRRRNNNRVCIRQLGKISEKKVHLVMGNTFFRLETKEAQAVVEKDQVETEAKVEKLRNGMKEKMEKVYNVEGRPMLRGFDLKPLNEEIKAMLPEMKFL